MQSSINSKLLRTLASDEITLKLSSIRLELPDDVITDQLLDAIELGSISTSVFDAWFRVCQSPVVVRRSLTQKVSVHVRFLGIEELRNGLKSTQWEEFWEGLGGTVGLLEIFSDLSVLEVKEACKVIAHCAKDADVVTKRERVTELFKGLHPTAFPDAAAKTNDLRPLTKFYQALVPGCSSELVDWVMSQEQERKWQHVKEKKLLENHPGSIEKAAFRTVFGDAPPDRMGKERLRQLSTRFPSDTTFEPRFSASMNFALRLLNNIVATGSAQVGDQWVITNLVRPLLRRAVRKHASWPRTQEIVEIIIKFLEKHPNAAKNLTNRKGDVLHMVALCWSRRSALFEVQLKRLLKITFQNRASFEDIESLLFEVPRSRRYALLHLSCQEAMGLDIDSEQDLFQAQGRLPSSMLSSLEALDALGLFQRLRKVKGDADLVDLGPYSSVLGTTRTPNVYEGDPDLYYLVLLNRNGREREAESHATEIVETQRKITQVTSDRDTRAEYALSVWACANASGSLKLLSETVQWAKGFVRDQLTASRLFSTYYDETYRLLSGFLAQGKFSTKPQNLRQRVVQANVIMTDLLHMACEAIREPFFQPNDWRKTLDLFTQVIKERVKLSVALKAETAASYEDVYYELWEDTIELLLQAERLVNDEENSKLRAGTITGIVNWQSIFSDVSLDTCGKDVWMFVDTLAKARNDLWTDLRIAKCPDVLTLPRIFPRGLPVQTFLSTWNSNSRSLYDAWTPDLINLRGVLPYIYSRVEGTLFSDPETALEPIVQDKSMRQAIGVFVDSYAYCLRLYIPDTCEVQEKKKRLRKVWAHATGPLSSQRLDKDEAFRYWKPCVPAYLQKTLGEIIPEGKSARWPRLPKSENPSLTQEWNPFEGRPSDVLVEARSLGEATYVDFATVGTCTELVKPDIWSHYPPLTPSIPGEDRTGGSIWASNPYAVGSESHEAAALAALLYLDTKYGRAGRFLAKPFPSSNDVRYPCLYLDEEFLSTDGLVVLDAVKYAALGFVPLPLVHQVAAALVERLMSKHNSHTLEQAALELVRALCESDRPVIAFDLAIRLIIGKPSVSSWHRVFFNNGFLQRISASDAKKCISIYAACIGEALDTQKLYKATTTKAGRDEEDNSTDTLPTYGESTTQSRQPTIKVTTLKSLAQVLHGSLYISDDASLEITSSLLQKVSHIDVRVSILKSLLSKLDNDRPELWDNVLSALETFIPLAGSLNEREPLSRTVLGHNLGKGDLQSQNSSEESYREPTSLPSIQLATQTLLQGELPLLNSVLSHFKKLQDGELLYLYLHRILIPIINHLEDHTTKWARMFLAKYASDKTGVLDTVIPPIPKGFYIVDAILSKRGVKSYRVPRTLLDKYVAYWNFVIKPPESILRLNQALEKSPADRSFWEIETWLELYGNNGKQSPSIMLPFEYTSNFDSNESGSKSRYVTAQTYQKAFLEVFRTLLSVDGPSYDRLGSLASNVFQSGDFTEFLWNDYGRATIELMIENIKSIRTRDWERNSDRTPAVLPDIFPWRLMLLSYPFDDQPDLALDENRERRCKAFAQHLAALLDEISGSVYHEKLQLIKSEVQFKQNTLLTAIYLGDVSSTRLSWLTTSDLLRIDLAAYMICRWTCPDIGPLEGRLKALLGTWIASENEEVRRTGYKVRALVFEPNRKRLEPIQYW